MRSSPSLISLLVSFAVCSTTAAQDVVELEASKYTPASLLERRSPVYPAGALSSGKEGWVMMSFVISPTGDVTEPMIEDSSGIEAFERAALRSVEGWKYTPATENGEPVEQAMVKTRIQFQLEDKARGASPAFTSKYRKIAALISERDFAAAEPLIAELEFGERTNLYEDAWFWWTKYVYLAESGSTDTEEMRRRAPAGPGRAASTGLAVHRRAAPLSAHRIAARDHTVNSALLQRPGDTVRW